MGIVVVEVINRPLQLRAVHAVGERIGLDEADPIQASVLARPDWVRRIDGPPVETAAVLSPPMDRMIEAPDKAKAGRTR